MSSSEEATIGGFVSVGTPLALQDLGQAARSWSQQLPAEPPLFPLVAGASFIES